MKITGAVQGTVKAFAKGGYGFVVTDGKTDLYCPFKKGVFLLPGADKTRIILNKQPSRKVEHGDGIIFFTYESDNGTKVYRWALKDDYVHALKDLHTARFAKFRILRENGGPEPEETWKGWDIRALNKCRYELRRKAKRQGGMGKVEYQRLTPEGWARCKRPAAMNLQPPAEAQEEARA